MAKKKPVVSKYGQWKYPGQETIIPNANGNITMQGVPYPVLGIDDLGNQQMMLPGMNYQFPGNSVYEIPMAKIGGTKKLKAQSLPKAQNGLTWAEFLQKVGVTDKDMLNISQDVIDRAYDNGHFEVYQDGISNDVDLKQIPEAFKQNNVDGKIDIKNHAYNRALASLIYRYYDVYPLSNNGSRITTPNIINTSGTILPQYNLSDAEEENFRNQRTLPPDLNSKYIDLYLNNVKQEITNPKDYKTFGKDYRDVPVQWVDAYPKQKLKGISNEGIDERDMFRMPVLYDDKILGQQDIPLLGSGSMRDYKSKSTRSMHNNPAIYPKPGYSMQEVNPVLSGTPNYGSNFTINGQDYTIGQPNQNYIQNQFYGIPATAMPGPSAENIFVDTPNSVWTQNYKNKMHLYDITQQNLARLAKHDPNYRVMSEPVTKDDKRIAELESAYINNPDVGFYQISDEANYREPCPDCLALQGSTSSSDASNYYHTYDVQYPEKNVFSEKDLSKLNKNYYIQPSHNPGISVLYYKENLGDGKYSGKVLGPVLDRDFLDNDQLQEYWGKKGGYTGVDYDPETSNVKIYDGMNSAYQVIQDERDAARKEKQKKLEPKIITPPPGFAYGGEPDFDKPKIDFSSRTKSSDENYLYKQIHYTDGSSEKTNRRTLKGFITGAPKPGEPGGPPKFKFATGGPISGPNSGFIGGSPSTSNATYQDSLNVANQGQAVIDWYNSQGYYGGRDLDGVRPKPRQKRKTDNNEGKGSLLHIGRDDISDGYTLEIPGVIGDAGLNLSNAMHNFVNSDHIAEWLNPYQYRQYADQHWTVLNTNAPKALYDTRIQPRTNLKLQGTAPGYFSGNADIVTAPVYEKWYAAPWSSLSSEDKRKRLQFGILDGTPFTSWNDERLINQYPDIAIAHGGRRQYDEQTIKNAALSGYAPTQEGAAEYEKNNWGRNPRIYDAETIRNAGLSGYPATQSGAAEYEQNGWAKKPAKTKIDKKPNASTDIGYYMRTELGLNREQSSYKERKKLAEKYGIKDYTGTGKQNIELINKIKSENNPKQSVLDVLSGKKLDVDSKTNISSDSDTPVNSTPVTTPKPQKPKDGYYRTPIHTANDSIVIRVHDKNQKFIGWEDQDGNPIQINNATGSPTTDFDPIYNPKKIQFKFEKGGTKKVKIKSLPKAQSFVKQKDVEKSWNNSSHNSNLSIISRGNDTSPFIFAADTNLIDTTNPNKWSWKNYPAVESVTLDINDPDYNKYKTWETVYNLDQQYMPWFVNRLNDLSIPLNEKSYGPNWMPGSKYNNVDSYGLKDLYDPRFLNEPFIKNNYDLSLLGDNFNYTTLDKYKSTDLPIWALTVDKDSTPSNRKFNYMHQLFETPPPTIYLKGKDLKPTDIVPVDIQPQLQNMAPLADGSKVQRVIINTPQGDMVRVQDPKTKKFIRWENVSGESMDFEDASTGNPTDDFPEMRRILTPAFAYGGSLPKAQDGPLSESSLLLNRNRAFQDIITDDEIVDQEIIPKAQAIGVKKPNFNQTLNIPLQFQQAPNLDDVHVNMPHNSGWGDFTTHRTPSLYDAVKTGNLFTIEESINKYLGYPMNKAYNAADRLAPEGEDPIDSFRHPVAGMYTQQAIKDKVGIPILGDALGFLGANVSGIGHELSTIYDDERPLYVKLPEAGEDAFNNFIGSLIGMLPGTQDQKANLIYDMSLSNWLPDGVVWDGNQNMYFKDENGNVNRATPMEFFNNMYHKKQGGLAKAQITGLIEGMNKMYGINQEPGISDFLMDQLHSIMYPSTSKFNYARYRDAAAKYLGRDVFKGTALTADDIASAAQDFYNQTSYEYPLDLLLAQGQLESKLGKTLKSQHNYFNIGNTDEGAIRKFPSAKSSVLEYMNLMYNDYLDKGKKTPDDLLKPNAFVNYRGNRYASNPKYETDLAQQKAFIKKHIGI